MPITDTTVSFVSCKHLFWEVVVGTEIVPITVYICEFSSLIPGGERQWKIVCNALRGKYCQPIILYPAKVLIRCEIKKRKQTNKGENMVRQAEAFHTPFHRKFSEDIFPQTKVIKQELGRREDQDVADPNQEGNKA